MEIVVRTEPKAGSRRDGIGAGISNFDGQLYIRDGELQLNTVLDDVRIVAGQDTFVQVESGATLSGTGQVTQLRLLDGGILSPGNSPGEFTADSLIWNGGGDIAFELGSDNTTATSDLLTITGALTKGSVGVWEFDFSDGIGTPTLSETYTLLTFASTDFVVGDFAYTYSGALSGFDGNFTLNATSLEFTVTAIPEPGTSILLGLGLFAVAARRRHARRS